MHLSEGVPLKLRHNDHTEAFIEARCHLSKVGAVLHSVESGALLNPGPFPNTSGKRDTRSPARVLDDGSRQVVSSSRVVVLLAAAPMDGVL